MQRNGLLLVAMFSSLLGMAMATSGHSVVVANVTVFCPFAVNVLTPNQGTAYSVGQNVVLNYTLKTLAECSINDLTGNFVISYQSNDVVADTVSVGPLSATNVLATTYNAIGIDTSGWSNTLYYATLSLSTFHSANSSTQSFALLRNANVLISNLSISPSTIYTSTQLALTANISNDGQLASTGNVVLSLSITGPASYSFSYNVPALSPAQSEIVTLYFSNVTSQPGTYTVQATASFTAANGIIAVSSPETATYVVNSHGAVGGGGGGGGGGPGPAPLPINITKPITTIPELNFTSLPFITSVLQGRSAVVFFGLLDTAKSPEYVNMTVEDGYSQFVLLSSNSVYIMPGRSVAIEMDFISKNSTLPGTYVVPLDMKVSVANGTTARQTEYFLFDVMPYSSNRTSIVSQVSLLNSTTAARATIEIQSPSNQNITGGVLRTFIPLSLAQNISDISAYGLPNNITIVNGSYVISWPMNIPSSEVAYAYITLNRLRSMTLLQNIQNELVTVSRPPAASIMKIIDINIPTFYTNYTNEIQVEALYTGTTAQDVYYYLNGPPGTTIYNATQFIKMNPNQISNMKFYIKTNGQPGTILLNLYINTTNFNQTDTLPVLVIKSSFVNPQPPTGGSILALISGGLVYIIATAVALLAIYTGVRWIKAGRSRYSGERAEKLIRIRERIRDNDRQGGSDQNQ